MSRQPNPSDGKDREMYECSQCHRLLSRDDIVDDMCIDCKLDEENQLRIIREKIESMTCNYPGWYQE